MTKPPAPAPTGGPDGPTLYFSDHFAVDTDVLESYGAFDISVVSDLPLFIDPFLLFNSDKPEYQALHDGIVAYLRFLRDKASPDLDPGLLTSWYRFKEVKQNWLGFTEFGNEGAGLGKAFADALNDSLGHILANLGDETVTRGTHLEKALLIRGGVGRDSVSDFTTNLIKDYLLRYTEQFARQHLDANQCAEFAVTRALFNYATETWETRRYYLPKLRDDFVLLTPLDLLTRDDTWISHGDMIRKFSSLPEAVDDAALRGQINNYFRSLLSKKPTAKERAAAAQRVIQAFPHLIDLYIKIKEDTGDEAQSVSDAKTRETHAALVAQVKDLVRDLEAKTDFYDKPWTSYDECLERVRLFKHYIENQDGYRILNREGKARLKETDVGLFFGFTWCRTQFDVNREPNNGRGPVDFKASFGAKDTSLIEFKLASNSSLKRNLEKQVAIYEAANRTHTSVKVIVCYTAAEQAKVARILKLLKLERDESVVVIDARSDNKPSASKA
jgi:hypothetical protein